MESATKAESEWDSNRYWTAQDFETSARLHLQHWIWNFQLGYALHPEIDIHASKSLRIADVGAGNGAWVLEVARIFPKDDVELDGFDLSSSNFPAAGWLPSNLRFHVWDAFSEVPEPYVGMFDVVHIRTLCSAIVDNKVEILLRNLLKMLKPGGYLQWDENDTSTLACRVPDNESKADAAETLVKLQHMFSAQNKLYIDWLHGLPEILKEEGCELIAHEVTEPKRELARAWTDNMLLVWRSVIALVPEATFPLPPGTGLETMSRTDYAELFEKAVEETSKGASLGMSSHVFVARKGR